MENCNLRKYCCTFMVKMMMPGAASLNLQPINLQFVQKLAILQLYKIFLFHPWYDGGVKSSIIVYFCTLLYFLILIYYSFTIILNICNGWIFLVNCSMTGKTLSCHWSSKIRLLWWHTLEWGRSVGSVLPSARLPVVAPHPHLGNVFLKSCIFTLLDELGVEFV